MYKSRSVQFSHIYVFFNYSGDNILSCARLFYLLDWTASPRLDNQQWVDSRKRASKRRLRFFYHFVQTLLRYGGKFRSFHREPVKIAPGSTPPRLPWWVRETPRNRIILMVNQVMGRLAHFILTFITRGWVARVETKDSNMSKNLTN